jgi:hypothetical protein
VELNWEWEECTFATRHEALTSFRALTKDYRVHLTRAVLIAPPPKTEDRMVPPRPALPRFVN